MVALVKISESSLSDMMVLLLKGAYFMSVCGCLNASVISKDSRVDILVHDKPDMLNCFGENFTVSHTRVAAFLSRRFSSTFNGVVLVQCTIQVCDTVKFSPKQFNMSGLS